MHLTIFATTEKYGCNLSDEQQILKTDNFSKLKRCEETPPEDNLEEAEKMKNEDYQLSKEIKQSDLEL